MFNPLDMLQAQNGAGMQSVAQQFGLTPEQTRRAMEALMPAFALGMQRSAGSDPAGLSQFFGLPGSRPAAGPAETMLGQMFGQPALTQAILQQAASASGVGSQVLRQMLPMMAGAVVASLVHMLLNQQNSVPAQAPTPVPAANPFAVNPAWAEMMKAFLPAESPPKPSAAKVEPTIQTKPGPDAGAGSAKGVFQQMLETGAEVQQQNVKAMQGLFEAFWAEADANTSKPPASPRPDAASPEAQRPKKGARPCADPQWRRRHQVRSRPWACTAQCDSPIRHDRRPGLPARDGRDPADRGARRPAARARPGSRRACPRSCRRRLGRACSSRCGRLGGRIA